MSTDDGNEAPAAQGVRMPWSDVPGDVRQLVDAELGSRVVRTVETKGGFSPGPAVIAGLDNGRSVFIKAAGRSPVPILPHIHRRESEILRGLPDDYPAPGLVAVIEHDGWVVLVIEALDGVTPAQPWRRDELDAVLELVATMGRVGDPSPIPDLPRVGHEKPDEFAFDCWARVVSQADGEPRIDDLPAWARENLDRLVDLETDWAAAATGSALVHGDLRADNIVLTADGAVAVDWPGAAIGPPWIDLAGMVPSIEMVGGPSCEEIFDVHPVADGADQDAVNQFVTALGGYFVRSSLQPPPPGLPTLRPFQRAQGDVVLRWLAERLRLSH